MKIDFTSVRRFFRPPMLPRIIRVVLSALVFALVIFAFCHDRYSAGFAARSAARFLPPQAGPAFLAAIATGATAALVVSAAFIVLALLFGRVYCAFMCPLGILQDFLGWITRRKCKPQKNPRILRYSIFAATLGLLAAGWALGAQLFEPFTLFGRMVGGAIAGGAAVIVSAATFVVILALVVWKKRVFCTAICPVGTLLGLCAKVSLFKLRINKTDCVHCGICAKKCPAGCIDVKNAEIDNERCVRCMNCVGVCIKQGIEMKTGKGKTRKKESGEERRAFIATICGVLGMAISTFQFGKNRKPGGASRKPSTNPKMPDGVPNAIFPPGAGSAERFASKCTGCLLCVANCTSKIIKPPTSEIPALHLEYTKGMCEYECAKCGAICPTGALRKMPLAEKKLCRIGMVEFNEEICVAFVDGTDCGACAEHCPTGALRMRETEIPGHGMCRVPVVNEELCIGCGSCEYPCPVRPERAIVVKPVPIQVQATSPEEFFKRPPAPAPAASDEWLI